MNATTDRTTVLLVIGFIGLATLLLIGGALILVNGKHAVPGEIWTLAGTALGALGAVLVSTRSSPPGPPAEPVNPPARTDDGIDGIMTGR